MVLVSNEFQNNKDDEQKPNAGSTATTTTSTTTTVTPGVAAGAATVVATAAAATVATTAAVNNGLATGIATITDQELTARPIAVPNHPPVELSKRQQRLNKKAQHKMELNNKAEQEQLLLREKHELETSELSTDTINLSINSLSNNSSSNNDANDNLENQENNNMPAAEICDSNTSTLLQGQLAQQQLQMAISSALNANNMPTNANTNANTNPNGNPNTATGGGMYTLHMPIESATPAPSPALLGTGEAKIVLHCEGKSHKFETRTISLAPTQECKVGRLIAKSKASEGNAIFDCKVLSRNHAMLWYTQDGHFWVKDTKSSNGTFINDNKLGNEPAELHYGDTVKFGVEVIENSRQEIHGCIIARVTLFLPDGREAISIESEHMQLAGPNRISYDEIQRLNAFLQEASQREKMLKAKLSNLQGVLDSTRKNSAMCWQSMITEDQLLHKINLLEKKLQMMEKNVPENALRNEIVKLLEDKTTYQLSAKEALRKVYQDRCDAMQMLSKMELAYTTSDNECSILRAQILNSKQTLQDFNTRLEQLQLEYTEYKQESLRQQQEAKELEEQRLGQLKEQLNEKECVVEQLRQQLMHLQQTIAEHDSEQALQQQQALEQLNAAIGDDDDDDDYDDEDDDDNVNDNDNDEKDNDEEDKEAGDHENDAPIDNEDYVLDKDGMLGESSEQLKKEEQTMPSKQKMSKKMMNWLKNSDLNKGADGGDVLNAIFNDADSGDDEHEQKPQSTKSQSSSKYKMSPGETEAETASDEFIHKSPKHNNNTRLNGIEEATDFTDLPQEHAMDMLHEECQFYKLKSNTLSLDICALEEQMKKLQQQLLRRSSGADKCSDNNAEELATDAEEQSLLLLPSSTTPNVNANAAKDIEMNVSNWREELDTINDAEEEREEELIVYKERLEQAEMSNLQLRNEITQMRLKQPLGYDNQLFYRRALPLGCVALAALIYFLSIRF